MAAALLVSGCAAAVDGTPTWAGTRVGEADLASRLLTAREIHAITGVELPDETVGDAFVDIGLPDTCRQAWEPGVQDTYRDAPVTGLAWSARFQLWDMTPSGQQVLAGFGLRVHQALVSVDSEAAADDFLAALPASWSECSRRSAAVPPRIGNRAPRLYHFGTVEVDDSARTVSIARTYEGTDQTCERMITTSANVIVDVSVCDDESGRFLGQIVGQLRAAVAVG